MMGTKNNYRFLDQKTSRHAGTFLKIQEKKSGKSGDDQEKAPLDQWELVIEPPVSKDKLKSDHLKCVRRSMPPEMMLAAGIVAQMMVDRKPDGRLNGTRGLVEEELGKGLGRKVKPLLPNLLRVEEVKV
ncbi:UNVERIFIED_CONTAM: hypothetical protein HDU68_009452 [Siphonaria sp. JEL0065]|nr:hypothetical protein HDU68_009452 [Siphonaria sp. JEL0065]